MNQTKHIKELFGKRLLHTTALMSTFAVMSPFAWAGPENGVVTGGSAGISQNGHVTTINQSSDRAIIRWDRFNLDVPDHVQFVQPTANSITVNRIRDTNASRIDGSIGANGKVVLINPNGILFGGTAKVDVGGLVATTSDLDDDDAFMHGGAVKFTKPGKGDAKIVNDGEITVKEAGLVGLVAPQVENNGVIRAKLGKVQLASGDIHTIDFAGDGLIKIEVSDQISAQSIRNSGTIEADGGEVLVTAAQARNAVDALIVNTGTIRANTVGNRKGKVKLSTKGLDAVAPSRKGTIINSGVITTEGDDHNETGGDIDVIADFIALMDQARLNASGDTNGGTIHIGGNQQGAAGIPSATQVFVGDNAFIDASSKRMGQGGKVILWSDQRTAFKGNIKATGGSEGGNGGFVEVSSKGYLDYQGFADLRAVHGQAGTLLLDPTDILITNSSDLNVTASSPFTPTIDDGPSILNSTTLLAALGGGNVIVQTRATGSQAGDITVGTALTWASANTLTLEAHNNILVNSAITGRNLTLRAGGDIQLNSDLTATGTNIGVLTIETLNPTGSIGIGNGQAGNITLSDADMAHVLNGWGNIIIGRTDLSGTINIGAMTWTDPLTLRAGSGTININGAQTMSNNALNITTAGGSIATSANISTTTGALNFTTGGGALTIGTGGITAGTGSATVINMGTGLLTVNSALNTGSGALTITTDNDIAIGASGALTGTGALSILQGTATTTFGLGNSQTGTINLTGAELGRISNGWSSLTFGTTTGSGTINVGGTNIWNDNLILRNGTGAINISGTQTMSTNTINVSTTNGAITVGGVTSTTGTQTYNTNGAALTINGALTSTGTGGNLSLASVGGTITTSAAITTGAGSVTITSNNGNITFGTGGITTTSGGVNINSGTGSITANSILNSGSAAMTLTLDNDLALNVANALTGTGTLTIQQASTGVGIGLGDSQTGTLNLTTAEMGRIRDGWTSLVFGLTTSTQAVNVGALTFTDVATIRSGSGAININGALTTTTNSLTLTTTGGAIAINGGITTTSGALAFNSGGGNLTTAAALTTGAGSVSLNSANGALTIGTGGISSTSGGVGLTSGTGLMTINNTVATTSGNMTLTTDNLALNASLNGASTLTITPSTASTTVGVGTGQTGSLSLDDNELGRIATTWGSVIIGSATGTGAMNVGALNSPYTLTLRTGAGQLNLNGAITMAVNRNLTLNTDSDILISGNLTGSGTGAIGIAGSAAATTIGIGTGMAGTLQLSDAEVARIADGWNTVTLGSTAVTGAMNVASRTWLDNVFFRTNSGAINIAGASPGANNISILSTVGAINLTGAITTSTGTVTISTGGTGTMTIGGAVTTTSGAIALTNAAGLLTINSAMNSGSAAFSITTDSTLALNAGLSGTATLLIQGNAAASGMGIGTGETGTVQLTDAELAQIGNGFTTVTFGNTTQTGVTNLGNYSWGNNVTFRSNSGAINIDGATMGARNMTVTSTTGAISTAGPITSTTGTVAMTTTGAGTITIGGTMNTGGTTTLTSGAGQMTINSAINAGAGTLTLSTDSNLALNAALSGTGSLVIRPTANATTVSVGTGQTGTLNLSDTELAQITDGWLGITIGQAAQTSILNIGAATWNDSVTYMTTSVINVNGQQVMGANNLTFATNNDIAINAGLSGTQTLNFRPITVGTAMSIAGGSAPINLSTADLGNILNGWDSIVFGSNAMTGTMQLNPYTWQYDTTFRTLSGVITVAGAQTGKNMTFETDGNPVISAALAGSGILTFRPTTASTIIGINNGSTGLNLTTAEQQLIQDGWNKIVFGSNTMTGTLTLGTTTWNDDVQFITGSGVLTVSAGLTMNSGTNLTLTTNSNIAINGNLTGTGSLVIEGASPGTAIDINTSQGATFNLATAELNRIIAGWSAVRIGSVTSTGNINIGAMTAGANSWKNPTTFITNGDIRLYGSQNSALTSGTSLIFVTQNGAFNNTGAFTINPGAGARYLVYSVASGNNTLNGLTPTNTVNAQTYFSYGPGSVSQSGNVFIYSTGSTKIIYLQADNKTKVYGDAVPNLTYTYLGGLQGGDSLAAALTGVSLTATGALATDSVGTTRTITGTFTTALGYTVQLTDGALSVSKAPVSVQAANISRIYGDANPTFSIVYTGLRNGETSSVIDTLATASTTATATTGVGTATITTSGAIDNNYTFNYANGTMTITPAALTITADDKTKIYGDANPTLTASYTGLKNGETASVVSGLILNTVATTGSNVGSYTITASGATSANYTITFADGSLAVTPAALTITAQNATRAYGDANPTFTASYSGFKNGDTDASLTGLLLSTGATNTSNVGTYTIAGSGATNGNYDISYVDGTLTITKAMLTATVQNATRAYGDAEPTFNVLYTGFKNSEDNTAIGTLATVANPATILSNVGNYTLTASGADATNYDFTYVDGNLSITKSMLTATVQNATRVYGSANPAFTVVYTGFKNSEDSTVLSAQAVANTGANALSNVGSYVISASGAAAGNYDFTYVDGTLNITKAMLTATVQNATREYGAVNPAFSVIYTGFVNGQDNTAIGTLATAGTAATATTNVGNYAITASGAAATNYDFTYVDGVLNITKAMLTATVQNATRQYGAADPSFNIVYTGFKNGEGNGVIGTLATASTNAVATSNVGAYTISVGGAAATNYDFTYVDGTLSITKAMLTATVQNATREYGDTNPSFNIVYTGFRNGEDKTVIDTLATVNSGATGTTGVGNYGITASGAIDNNYDFTYVGGTLGINKATVTATAQNATRQYGSANPTLAIVYSGFKNGEDETVLGTQATASTSAVANSATGTYAITIGGGADSNYDFNYTGAILTITKAMLTATVQNATREYGDANPSFNIVYTGFKNGEDNTAIGTLATASTGAGATTGVGVHAITASGASAANYDFTYVNGALTITKAMLTATAQNATRQYGNADPAFNVVYTGFKNGEGTGVINTQAIASTGATATSNVGSYGITVSGAADDNYDFTYVGGTLDITKAMLTATAQNATRIYGDANPGFTVVYTGFKNGEDETVIGTQAVANSSATVTTGVGNHTISASGANDTNYDFTYVDGTLTITKATLTATAQNASREYGSLNPAFVVAYTGFKNGEDETAISTLANGSTIANINSNVGSYGITASGALADNYDFTYVGGTLDVTKAMLTATVQNATRIYGDANPTFGIVYTGFKNGQNSGVIDTLATANTGAIAATGVGSYGVTASGALDNNYDFTYVGGTLNITKAMLTVTAQNATREYGNANPGFTVAYTGFKNGEGTGVLNTLATAASTANNTTNAGNHAITAGGAAADNYDFTYVNGNLIITKALLTATVQNATRDQYSPNPAFIVTYTGFKNGEDNTVIDSYASTNTLANPFSAPGTYAVNASGAIDNNYDFAYVAGILTVNATSTPSGPIGLPPTVDATLNNNLRYNTFDPGTFEYNFIQDNDDDNLVLVIPEADIYASRDQDNDFLIALTEDLAQYFNEDDKDEE